MQNHIFLIIFAISGLIGSAVGADCEKLNNLNFWPKRTIETIQSELVSGAEAKCRTDNGATPLHLVYWLDRYSLDKSRNRNFKKKCLK